MAKRNIEKEIFHTKLELGLIQKIPCSKEDNEKYYETIKRGEGLPEGVCEDDYTETFYTLCKPDLTHEQRQEYILLRQYEKIKTIKNCVVFFTVLTIISLVASIILCFLGYI